MSNTYFKSVCSEGFLILYGDMKKPTKAYVIGVVYDASDADVFVKALITTGKTIEEPSEEELLREEPVEDLVDELERGLSFNNAIGESYDSSEWAR